MATYKGKYKPKNPQKYVGDLSNVVYRSSWERAVFKYLDNNNDVIRWGAEAIVIPYRCGTDNKIHRYFPDIYYETIEGEYLVEIKPKKECIKPKPRKKTKKYVTEVMTYIKNQSKWNAAEDYVADRGWKFLVWHEEILRSMGIKVL